MVLSSQSCVTKDILFYNIHLRHHIINELSHETENGGATIFIEPGFIHASLPAIV